MRQLMIVVVVGVGGCLELPTEAPPLPQPPDPPPALDGALQDLEDAVFDKLECEEKLRPSTLERIQDVIEGADVDTVRALLLNPQDLASVVALGGLQVEAPVIVARNLYALYDDGAVADLVDNGWDGVSCGEAVAVLCTAGGAATVVDCDANDEARAVALSFDKCAFRGVVYDGDVAFVRDDDDDSVAVVGFDGFSVDEFRAFEGSVVVDVGAGSDRFAGSVVSPDVFTIKDHGGVAGGLDCGVDLEFAAVSLDVDDDDGVVVMDAIRKSSDGTIGVETFGDHLTFASGCGCPQPGSGAFVDVPRPLGRAGEAGRASITWGVGGAGLCSKPTVSLVDWPTDCVGLDDVDGDCARSATEQTLSDLMSALCVE